MRERDREARQTQETEHERNVKGKYKRKNKEMKENVCVKELEKWKYCEINKREKRVSTS